MLSRVAVVFDNTLRPETTGLYVRRALGRLVAHVEHVLPADLNGHMADGFDAYVVIDDGLDYRIPDHLRPRAWWAIDTHIHYDRSLNMARTADCVFAAQRDGTLRLQHDGIDSAKWLPLACDPDVHRPYSVPVLRDMCFVGNKIPGPRAELLETLRQHWPQMFMGRAYFEQMALVYNESRIAFNRSVADDVNMRVFEAPACKTLLLTNNLSSNGQEMLLQDGKHLITYESAEDLLEKARYYLAHADERQRIAAAGRAEVHSRHTYEIRVRGILSELERVAGRTTVGGIRVPAFQASGKDGSYFDFARPEVLALVPTTSSHILDIGCGTGRLGENLRRRQPCEVWGIERDPQAAAVAATHLDRVLNVDVETDHGELPDAFFDCIVCADVLEHLRHPEKLLTRLRRTLKTDGCIALSLPNVQHHSILTGLLNGDFTYEPAGLLDEDHLRLFTRREVEKMLFRSGFQIRESQIVPGPGWNEWHQSGSPGEVRIGGLAISGLDREHAENFFAYQFLICATPVPTLNDGITSIILVTHNQLEYTRQCLNSIRFRTDEPYELIVVDNGSTDGTADYLQAQTDVKWILNPDNRGFPAAANQGLRAARGTQLLLLNNDTIVTTGWLRRMLDAMFSDSRIGLVGPVSNSVSGLQQISVNYSDLSSLDGFAWERGKLQGSQRQDLDRLVGFCLLIRRELCERIGLLDERFGIGCFEDDDYCRRARNAGFRTIVALDSFVHHFGGRTFRASGIHFAELMQENQKKFDDKWQTVELPAPAMESAKPLPKFRFERVPEGGLLLVPICRVSLCMIVRNNENTIGQCLESIKPWVDEMIVVDTGSNDSTPAICEKLGARVFHWAWRDSFAAARNQSLKYASGDWIFWMDSDDTIPEECGRKLRELVNGPHSEQVFGYVMQVHCPGPESKGGRDVTVVDHVKLFRNRPDLRFEHRIHEQILPAIRRAGGEVQFTEIYVVHSGADHTPEGRVRKLERDFKLLDLDLAEHPDHPFVLFNLGMTYADAQQLTQAAHWLSRCLEVSRPEESHVRKAYALLLSVLQQQSRFDEAYRICETARRQFPDDKEILFRQAMLLHHRRKFDAAASSYLAVIGAASERHFVSIDVGLAGFKARHNLALVYEESGRFELAEKQWQAISDEHPDYKPAQVGRIDCLIRQKKFAEASLATQLLRQGDFADPDLFRLTSRIAEEQHQLPEAARALESGLQNHPESPVLLRELARLNYEVGDFATAQAVLQRLTAVNPTDSSAWQNLGVVLTHLNRTDEAHDAFEMANQAKPGRN